MKRSVSIILFLLLTTFGFSTIPPYRMITDVIYARKAGMALTYDVLMPEDSSNGAGVIHIVSAGWKSSYLPIDSTQAFYAPLLEKGYTVFVLRHGSAPYFKLPDIVNDIQEGVAFISEHARDYSVDPGRLGIYGGSAGGQLALMTGTMHEKSPVAAVVAFFPPTDLRTIPPFAIKMYPALDIDTTALASASPIAYVDEGDAPALLIHGDLDFFVPVKMSENMYDTLVSHHVPAKFVLVPGMMHGGMFGGKGKYFEQTTGEMLKWFDAYLLPSATADTLSEKHKIPEGQ